MKIFSFFILLVLLSACGGDKDAYLKPLNLLEYGVPLTIMAPDSVDVSKDKFGISEAVTVKTQKSDDYEVVIIFGDATGSTAEAKAEQLSLVKGAEYFSEIVLDEPNGFIYKSIIDKDNVNYGFRRIIVMGSEEYIFQNSYGGSYTKEQAEEIYKATAPQD